MFEEEFLDTMVDEVTWEPSTGYDADGAPAFGTGVTIKCRVSPRARKVLDAHGTEVVSAAVIYTEEAPAVSPNDRITLPDGSQPVIIRVERPPDRDGAHHTEIYV